MSLRSLPIPWPIVRTSLRNNRSIHFTLRVLSTMEGGISTQELEEAIQTRLSAVHTQVNDISGTS